MFPDTFVAGAAHLNRWAYKMIKKLALLFVICSSLASSHVFAESNDCVLPVADGGEENLSLPTMQGIISSHGQGVILLNGNENSPIEITAKTTLFTIYGGLVLSNQIKNGQHVLVWLVGCKTSNKNVAAVVQFCSKGTEPCPK